MQVEFKNLDFYTRSIHKNCSRETINVGTASSSQNIKLFKLSRSYNNPVFHPRRFEEWPDTFEILHLEDQLISIRRTDQNTGWGANLLIDIDYQLNDVTKELPSDNNIPRIIYQTFKSRKVPKGMFDAVTSWKDLNPNYEHYFYDNDDCIDFIKRNFDKSVYDAYFSLLPPAFRADLWRCCVLYENGGVYVDSDMICLVSLNDFIKPNDEFIVARDDPMSKSYLYNAFIACVPKHKFIEKQINSIVDNVKNKRDLFYLDISGPGLLGKSVNLCLGRDENCHFDLGNNHINNYYFNIFRHDFSTKSIKNEEEKSIIYTEYDNKNKEMNSLKIPTYYSLYTKGVVYQKIPRKIYYTTENDLHINGYMIESFKDKNKNWTLEHYGPEQRLSFFKKNNSQFIDILGLDVLSIYENLKTPVEKTDFWRYCIIFLNGGVYVDSDTYCARPLDEWIVSHDLIFGIEANIKTDNKAYWSSFFGVGEGAHLFKNNVVSVCNWAFAAEPKNKFFKDLITKICNNLSNGSSYWCSGHWSREFSIQSLSYFSDSDFAVLDNQDIVKGNSIMFNINKFGSNQSHSNSCKFSDLTQYDSKEDVYIVHTFDGIWRLTPHKEIKKFKSKLGTSHNLSIKKIENGYFGVSRLDKDTSRTIFPKKIGDCRSFLKMYFDENFNLLQEIETDINNYSNIAKFEDYRIFSYCNKDYLSVSYIDELFNTRVALLDDNYNYLGDVNIDKKLNDSPFSEGAVWEKNWLFFEHNNDLYFIYSTMPNYIVYKCIDFNTLSFEEHINTPWLGENKIPSKEFYYTKDVLVGGSTNPIFIKEKDVYLYFIHTKIYNERKYNNYAVILNKDLVPIKFCKKPILSKYLKYGLLFLMSIVERDDYIVFSGGIEDNTNFVWELSKSQIFKSIEI